jgi:dimethylglycine dehydrogenase
MNSMRIEKAYKAWQSELTTEITPVEAVLDRFVDWSGDFIGKAACEERRALGDGVQWFLVYCEVDAGSGETASDCRGNEPVRDPADGRIIGIVTSGAYGHTVGTSLAFAYVEPAFSTPGSTLDIQLFGERRRATVLADAAYDPTNAKLRG